MLYMAECWTIKNQRENKVNVVETTMLRWMCSKSIHDRIINKNIMCIEVTIIVKKMIKYKFCLCLVFMQNHGVTVHLGETRIYCFRKPRYIKS